MATKADMKIDDGSLLGDSLMDAIGAIIKTVNDFSEQEEQSDSNTAAAEPKTHNRCVTPNSGERSSISGTASLVQEGCSPAEGFHQSPPSHQSPQSNMTFNAMSPPYFPSPGTAVCSPSTSADDLRPQKPVTVMPPSSYSASQFSGGMMMPMMCMVQPDGRMTMMPMAMPPMFPTAMPQMPVAPPQACEPPKLHSDSHLNHAWASLADCAYERFPAGFLIKVVYPDDPSSGKQTQSSKYRHEGNCKLIQSDAVLKTRLFDNLSTKLAAKAQAPQGKGGLDVQRPTCKVCAHFMYKGRCHRGAQCQFVHVVQLAKQ